MSPLKQNNIRKWPVDKTILKLEFESNDSNWEKYKVETFCNGAIYANSSENDYLPVLYYQVSWKDFLEEDNA